MTNKYLVRYCEDYDGDILAPGAFKKSLFDNHHKLNMQHSLDLEKRFLEHQWHTCENPWKYGCQLIMPFGATFIISNPTIQIIKGFDKTTVAISSFVKFI